MSTAEEQSDLDVDIRFLLASERTLLAWIRTGLTLIAGGVALAFLAVESRYGTIAGLGAIGFGGVLGLIGYKRYRAANQAIRRGELPPAGIGGLIALVGVAIFAAILLIVRNFGL